MTVVDEKREWTQADLAAEARRRFGDDPTLWAFVCPSCGDVATVADFIRAGEGERAGQECIGRLLGALSKDAKRGKDGIVRGTRGCDWAAYGLFHGPWSVVMPADDLKPERTVWSFRLAPAPEAVAG